ncbi:MAG TPA: hypothetical protein VHN79_01925 [Lacunisphaera sp.]|nr:hypothetical protein [Lacunisphaera sp.]
MKPASLPALTCAVTRGSFVRFTLALVAVGVACVLPAPLRAAVPSLSGTYESEGSIIETTSDYAGPVSLRALLALELDLALGAKKHADISRIEIEQKDRTFTIRTRDEKNAVEWTGRWERNGGYEATPEGVKILLRPSRASADLFMFTLTTIKDGAVLMVEVQRVEPGKFGPLGKPVGKFLFLRVPDAS